MMHLGILMNLVAESELFNIILTLDIVQYRIVLYDMVSYHAIKYCKLDHYQWFSDIILMVVS